MALLRKAGLLEDETGLRILPLSRLCAQRYGAEYIAWPWEALSQSLREDFGGQIGPVTADRVQAGQLLLAHDMAWKEWEVFEKLAAAAQGVPAIFGRVQPPEPEHAAVAMAVLADFAPNDYHDDVLGYILAACLDDGLWYLEAPLDKALPLLSEMDRRIGIERDFGGVASVLRRQTDYNPSPTTSAEVQTNRAIAVRKAVAEYRVQVDDQLGRLP